MGFIKYTTALMLVALFSIALVTFAINFASDNSASIDLSDDDDLSGMKDNIKSEVETFHANTETAGQAYAESTISSQTEASEGGTQFKVTPWNSLSMAREAVSSGWKKIFGEGAGFAVIFTGLVAILGFMMIMYAYKAWVGRNPD